MRLIRARGSTKLREVAPGSATQGLWLRNGKVGSQISGMDRSRFLGRRTVWEIRRGQRPRRKASDRAKKRREYTVSGLDLGKRKKQVVCHASALALAMTDEARREAGI